jgi:hypothetical protein
MEFRERKGNRIWCMYVCAMERGFSGGWGGEVEVDGRGMEGR